MAATLSTLVRNGGPEKAEMRKCPSCGSVGEATFVPWARHCRSCDIDFSNLEARIEESVDLLGSPDERWGGLEELRLRNYRFLLNQMLDSGVEVGSSYLDVGCGHGWFVSEASRVGLDSMGIEPDGPVADQAAERGLAVLRGYFPDCLEDGARFDVISIADVLEHLPDPTRTIADASRRLNDGGLLVIAVPNRRGAAARLARVAYRLGLRYPARKIWQYGYPSPHFWYFSPKGIATIVEGQGLSILKQGPLQTVSRSGLQDRLKADKEIGWRRHLMLPVLWLCAPVLNSPTFSDSEFLIARKVEVEEV